MSFGMTKGDNNKIKDKQRDSSKKQDKQGSNTFAFLCMTALKLLLISLCLIFIIAALSIVYGFILHGGFTLRYIFNANFLVGVLLIAAGIVIMFLPNTLAIKTKLFDHSTMVEKSYDSRENRQQKARLILWLGLIHIVLTGSIQLLLSVLLV